MDKPQNSNPRRYTLGKKERLKKRKGFDFLFAQGQRLREGGLAVVYTFDYPPQHLTSPLMVAFGVSKRRFRRAHDRNRVKRQLREAFRLNKHLLLEEIKPSGKSLVLLINYLPNQHQDSERIHKNMVRLLKKLASEV